MIVASVFRVAASNGAVAPGGASACRVSFPCAARCARHTGHRDSRAAIHCPAQGSRAGRRDISSFRSIVDSAIAASPTAAQIIGAPFVDSATTDSLGTTRAAAYRFAAWDVGPQPLGLANIAVTVNGRTAYISLNSQTVFVRSVLPADTTLRQPKPPRPPIVLAAVQLAAVACAARCNSARAAAVAAVGLVPASEGNAAAAVRNGRARVHAHRGNAAYRDR